MSRLNRLIALLYLVTGLVNLTPGIGAFGPDILSQLYGLSFTHNDLALLIRHRAVLLALVGALLMLAAFFPTWRNIAACYGLVSMLSFLLLYRLESVDNAALLAVYRVDLWTCVALACAWALEQVRLHR